MKVLSQEDNHCLIITEKFELFKLRLAECVNGELIIIKEIESSKDDKIWKKYSKISFKECLKLIKKEICK